MMFKIKNKKRIIIILLLIISFIPILYSFCKFKLSDNVVLSMFISKPQYTVVFNSNGGTGSMANQNFTYGTAQNLTANTFTKTNYVFDSWNTEEDGTGTSYSDQESVNNLASVNNATVNLYAQWVDSNITVTFDANGGTTPSFESTVLQANSNYGSLPYTTKSGYSFVGWSTNTLPLDYQELEYIQFSGGAYIDTGVIPSNHTTEVKFDFNLESASSQKYLFGTGTSSYYDFSASQSKFRYAKNGSYGEVTYTSGIHHLIYNGDNNAVILDYNTIASGTNLSISNSNLIIGKGGSFEGKVYYVIITNKLTGEPERILIPCIKKSDQIVGFYDTVNGVFYEKLGGSSSSLVAGNNASYITTDTPLKFLHDHTLYAIWGRDPDVTFDPNGGTTSQETATFAYGEPYGPLPTANKSGSSFKGWKLTSYDIPDEYQEVEYLLFNGNSYIDSGLSPNNIRTEVKFDFMTYNSGESLFNTNTSGSSTTGTYDFHTSNSIYNFNGQTSVSISSGIHELIYNDDYGKIFLDGNLLGNYTNPNITSNVLIGKNGSTYLKGKIYSFKMYNKLTEEYERIFVPCYRKSDNVLGLYDIVNNVFYSNSGSGTFGKGQDINYQTSSTIVSIEQDYTLYAVWEEPKYTINVTVNNGTVDESSKQVYEKSSGIFGLTPTLSTYISNVTCTNGQKAMVSLNVLTVKNVTSNTTCTVTYSDPGSTVLYNDGTLIINEPTSARTDNIALHGTVTAEFAPFSNENDYSTIITATSSTLPWYSYTAQIMRVEIGQEISPTSTSYWFSRLTKLRSGDFTNLNTSNVTNMLNMFYISGSNQTTSDSNPSLSFVLTGLDNWDTSEVTNMSGMFDQAGTKSKTWNIGDLSNWDTRKVTSMSSMFNQSTNAASTSSNSIGNLQIYAYNIDKIFNYAYYMKGSITIHNNSISYSSAFVRVGYSSASSSALITVNYDCSVEKINSILATGNGTNVVKGTSAGNCRAKLVIHDATAPELEKYGSPHDNIYFTVTPNNAGSIPAVTCTNNQTYATLGSNTFYVTDIDIDTECTLYYEKVTILYNNGRLIINEDTSDRASNQSNYGATKKIYEPFSQDNDYVFSSFTNIPWFNEKNDITSAEVGSVIAPTSTAMWFAELYKATSIDVSKLNVSNVTDMTEMFYETGYNSTVKSFAITGLDNWNLGEVLNMRYMFYRTGHYASTSFDIGDLTDWDVDYVTDMRYMFKQAGYYAPTWNIGDLSDWDTEDVLYMTEMFNEAGYKASTWSIGDISDWDVQKVTKMDKMFLNAGHETSNWSIGDLSNWVPKSVTTMEDMFNGAGYKSSSWSLDLSDWDVKNVTTMKNMFTKAGHEATTWSIGDVSAWETDSLLDLAFMFNEAGYKATNWTIDVSGWNVEKVTSMEKMFYKAGYSATTWSIGNLQNWNPIKATIMTSMFENAGYSASTSYADIGKLKVYATSVESMFKGTPYIIAILDIYSKPTSYTNMFNTAATDTNASIVANYSSATTNIDTLVGTKSATSNVSKGNQLD